MQVRLTPAVEAVVKNIATDSARSLSYTVNELLKQSPLFKKAETSLRQRPKAAAGK